MTPRMGSPPNDDPQPAEIICQLMKNRVAVEKVPFS